LRLIVQSTEMAPSVAKINADGHSSCRHLSPKIERGDNTHALLHFVALLFLHFSSAFSIRQLTAIEVHRPSHPILTGEAGGPGAGFQQEGQATKNCPVDDLAIGIQGRHIVETRAVRKRRKKKDAKESYRSFGFENIVEISAI